ncbi:protein PLASTID MOVEMENT IMPAIRED 2 isoform X2 [Nymphaea colorata]|uniref:protein PLASTID MOVEMENT IMPAIRED 2 isoform X2 n=1 Tax=Nymphaea colorata TaxID=210225 RepID=UPI00129D3BC2|nr:protein PLASTID MOVEMENT IMPAIRED 2 isoform X2 [Nymphaea colorata]
MQVAEREEIDSLLHKGSVKAAVNLFGEKQGEGNGKWKKTNISNPEESELHIAKRSMNKFIGSVKVAEDVKSQAGSELHAARRTAESMKSQIQVLRASIEAELKKVRVLSEQKWNGNFHSRLQEVIYQYNEVQQELELAKLDLRKLQQDMRHALEIKTKAELQTVEFIAKARADSVAESILRNKVEEANEEHVLVELATIEATKELRAVEAEIEANAAHFSRTKAESQWKIRELLHELSFLKDLEATLELTNSEIEVLQYELTLMKEMEGISQKAPKRTHTSLAQLIFMTEEDDLAASTELASVITELDQSKRELQSLREEGFRCMTSMDIIRKELRQASTDTARSKGLKEQAESRSEGLNSKLLKARKELESATAAEENVKSIFSDLVATLTQLSTEAKAAKGEKETIYKEIQKIKLEIQEIGIATNESEQRLQLALQDLEEIKAAEMITLETLSILSEKIVMTRAASSQRSPSITISSFEFEYLKARAEGADEIADKKVAAAKAWVEAARTAEKEIMMKTEAAEREIQEIKVTQEQELDNIKKTLAAKKVVEAELNKWKIQESEKLQIAASMPKKNQGRSMSVRRSRAYGTPSPAHWNYTRSPSFSLKKKKKKMVIPDLARLFKGRKFGKDQYCK